MLGSDWRGESVRGWLASEKFDGCRAYWDGQSLWSRAGNRIEAPAWFTAGLPADTHLEGEIYHGKDTFHASRDAVAYGRFSSGTRWIVFDAPRASGTILERLAVARAAVDGIAHVGVIAPVAVANDAHLRELFQSVIRNDGEGLMLHHPKANYHRGRTDKLLKVKL